MRVVVVVPARTGSTRLPGKVVLPLRGRPLLQRVLERISGASTPFDLLVATTAAPEDQIIRALTRSLGVPCYSGHPTDLLHRLCYAARMKQADVVVMIPSNCPLIDPEVVDRVLGAFLRARGGYDYASNLHPPTYPGGNDVEVMSMEALETARRKASEPHERELATSFIWRRPHWFRILNVTWEAMLDHPDKHDFTVYRPEDYAFVSAVYNELWSERRRVFRLEEVLALLRSRPDIRALQFPSDVVGAIRPRLRGPGPVASRMPSYRTVRHAASSWKEVRV